MSAPRFFCEQILPTESRLTLPSAVAHHIRVRRLKAGQSIVLFDGSGSESHATLQFDESGQPHALITSTQMVDRELPWSITLVQGIASQDRMDWVIEKAVEIGVSALIPVLTDRSVVKLSPERAKKRLLHWQKIVVSASEQCARNRLMTIHEPCSIGQAMSFCENTPLLWCHVDASTEAIGAPEMVQDVFNAGRACVIVGPEGGFSGNEAAVLQKSGARAVSLGPRILRTETAGLVAVSSLTTSLSAKADQSTTS